MSTKAATIVAGAILILSAGPLALGQQPTTPTQPTTTTVTQTPTTITKTVRHPDGTFTVIEYPVGKETRWAGHIQRDNSAKQIHAGCVA
ncbi:MAG: hypothetical protein LC770_02695 [Acidobacteria bacterium]|nr:hypothetical protein [Acidobacteriota bacterium]